ncbi:hypothetical protein GF373_13760 [bacterium]|nr:hypothetical protein [bacterium]
MATRSGGPTSLTFIIKNSKGAPMSPSILLFMRNILFCGVVLFAVTSIPPEEALQNVGSDDFLFLDVREDYEYETGHIPGALLYPLSSGVLEERWEEIPRDKPIIVYCRSGGRSAAAAQFLDAKGYPQILNMSGGFSTYKNLPNAKIETGPYQEPKSSVEVWEGYD